MLEIEAQNVLVIPAGNINTYTMKACLELLRELQNYPSDCLRLPENKNIITQLENRLKILVLSK